MPPEVQSVKKCLQPQLAHVERLIEEALRSDIGLLDQMNRKLREAPGKMMRPSLAILVAGACGKLSEDTYRYAAAMELLHNATLLHDDVVDGAALRRGLPTVYSLLGGGPAVLLGDFWLVRCVRTVLDSATEPEKVVRICAETLSRLAEGELFQMEKASAADTTQEDYIRIISCKTASLFEATARAAAISVRAGKDLEDSMGRFATLLGLMFQIQDDILDYASETEVLGKPVGIDLKEQKITQPLLSALEKVSPQEQQRIREMVAQAAVRQDYVAQILAFVREQDGIGGARDKVDAYLEQAIACLAILPPSREKEQLAVLARYVGRRER